MQIEEIIYELEQIAQEHQPCVDVGSGKRPDDDYISVDLFSPYCDVQADARHLPFADNTIGHILANNLLEHFTPVEANEALEEWCRVMKPGGVLVVMTPSIDAMIDVVLAAKERTVDVWNEFISKVYAIHDRPGMGHKWAYTLQTLALAIYGAGFHIRKLYQHFPPRPTPNCTVIAEKPCQ